jgi:hypothetical protein
MEVPMTLDDPRTRRLAFAGVSALTVLTWYALPDAIRSRWLRGVIKTGLLGITAEGVAMIPQIFAQELPRRSAPRIDLPVTAQAALAVGATAAAGVGTVWAEKAVYAYGERRRARGARCAHTPVAAALALATAAVALVDWPKLITRATKR